MRITLNHIYYCSWKKQLTKRKKSIDDMEEQILLMCLAQGKRTAFWQLWIPYQQQIYYCCHALMKSNYDDTEYAFNQVMFRVWHQLPYVADKITNLQAWLSRITNNICMEIYQDRKQITQCIESLDLVDRHTKSIQSQYFYNWLPCQTIIACSRWERFVYFRWHCLSSG